MIGKTISHFKIIDKIGEGGMGEVYLAEDTELDRKVALKFLPPHYTTDPEIKARFKREAKAAAALNHPNIITIHEVGEYEDKTYIAMEYVEGESLKDRIYREKLPIDKILGLALQMCEGLSKAHDAGIVHRDIKPENIIVDKDERIRILDFGLAKLKNVTKLTKESSTLGTLYYMSPEQLQGMEFDQRTDIWSLGVVLYEMITQRLPFQGEYEASLMYSVLNEEPKPATSFRSNVPEDLEQFVNKALAKNPDERFSRMNEFTIELILAAIEAVTEKDFRREVHIYRQLISLNPGHRGWLFSLGYAYINLGEYKNAIPYLEKVYDSNWKLPFIYYQLAQACHYVGDYEKELDVYSKAAEIYPQNPIWYYLPVRNNIVRRKNQDATVGIENLEKKADEFGWPLSYLYSTVADYYLEISDFFSTKSFLYKALENDSMNITVLYNIGKTALKERKLDTVYAILDKINAIRPTSPYLAYLLGQIAYTQKQFLEAREVFQTLVEKYPTFLEPYYSLGRTLENLGQEELSIPYYRTFIGLEYLNPDREDAIRRLQRLERKFTNE